MPEEDRQQVRVRIGLERGVHARFARLAEEHGVRETWLLELACWLGLPEVEARMERGVSGEHLRRRQLDEIVGAGGLTAADSANASAPAGPSPSGGGAAVPPQLRKLSLNEDRPSYSANVPRPPAKGAGGGKAKRRH